MTAAWAATLAVGLVASCGNDCPGSGGAGACPSVASETAGEEGRSILDAPSQDISPRSDVSETPDTSHSTSDAETVEVAACGDGKCQPALGEQCGSCPQDCSCPAGLLCADEGGCCLPGVCGDLGMECGAVTDDCGKEFDCGGCAGGMVCIDGACTDGVCKPALERVSSGKVLAVSIDGPLALAGTARELLVLQRSDAVALTLTSRIPVQWEVREVVVKGTSGYVLTRSTPPPVNPPVLARYEFLVLHIGVPETPEIVGSVVWTAAPGEAETTDLEVADGMAWLVLGGRGPYRLDVSDPDLLVSPVYALNPGGQPPGAANLTGLALSGSRLFMHDTSAGLVQYDVSGPGEPKKIAAWKTVGAQGGVAAAENVVVVGGAGELLVITPDAPGAEPVQFSGCGGVTFHSLRAQGNLVCALLHAGSVRNPVAVDFSDPTAPVCQVGSPLPAAYSLAMSGGTALVAGGDSGILAFDLASSDGLEPQGSLSLPEAGLRTGWIAGPLGCLGTQAGLGLWNLSRPEAPESLSFLPIPSGVCASIALERRILALRCGWYHSSESAGLLLVDRTDPTRPEIVEELPLPGIAMELTRSGGHGYLLLRSEAGKAPDLLRVDIGPDGGLSTQTILSLPLPSVRLVTAGDRLVSGFLLEKVSEQDIGGIDLLSVDPFGTAAVLGQFSLPLNGAGPLFAAHGGRVFIGQQEMAPDLDSTPSALLDVSGPASPVQVGSAVVHGSAAAMTVGRVWLPGTWGKMQVLDISTSEDLPILAYKVTQPDQTASYTPSEVFVTGGYAFLFGEEFSVVDVHGCWAGK